MDLWVPGSIGPRILGDVIDLSESHVYKMPALLGRLGETWRVCKILEPIWNVAGLHEPQILHGMWRVYTGPKFYRDTEVCTARDAGSKSQSLTPARSRAPHLLGLEKRSLQSPKTEASARGLRVPPPLPPSRSSRRRGHFTPSSTPPADRSSQVPTRLLPQRLYSSADRSSFPLRHAGQIGPLWPALEGRRFRISTAPVTLSGPAPWPEVRVVPTPGQNSIPDHRLTWSLSLPTLHRGSPPYLPSQHENLLNSQRSYINSLAIPPPPSAGAGELKPWV